MFEIEEDVKANCQFSDSLTDRKARLARTGRRSRDLVIELRRGGALGNLAIAAQLPIH